MIIPTNFLWEQMNGPQVKGLTNAIFEYIKDSFDKKLEYFDKMSVDTANNNHLSILGVMAGLARPVVPSYREDNFLFTEDPEHPVDNGFSSLDVRQRGGRFTTVQNASTQNLSLNESYFRLLLKTFTEGEGEIGSLQLLDDMCFALTKLDIPGVEPFYTFEYMSGEDIPEGRAEGDVFVDIGNTTQWHNPLQVYGVLKGVADSIYSPQPQLFISIGMNDEAPSPEASPSPLSYDGESEITLTSSLSNSIIYYTTDGSLPTRESSVYSAPIPVPSESGEWTIRAFTTADGYGDSQISVFTYQIS